LSVVLLAAYGALSAAGRCGTAYWVRTSAVPVSLPQKDRGWHNYLLLHHFDSIQTLDKLKVPNKGMQPTAQKARRG